VVFWWPQPCCMYVRTLRHIALIIPLDFGPPRLLVYFEGLPKFSLYSGPCDDNFFT
jgi:hypothetical protein